MKNGDGETHLKQFGKLRKLSVCTTARSLIYMLN